MMTIKKVSKNKVMLAGIPFFTHPGAQPNDFREYLQLGMYFIVAVAAAFVLNMLFELSKNNLK